jgi:hypothetical protein
LLGRYTGGTVKHEFRIIREVAERLFSMFACACDVLHEQTLDGVDTHAKENSLSPDEFKQVSMHCYYYYTVTLYYTLHCIEWFTTTQHKCY